MQSKLTLRLDEELIRFGKQWARSRGKSLSRVVADYLAMIEKLEGDEGSLPPSTRKLRGVIGGADVREADYLDHLEARHS